MKESNIRLYLFIKEEIKGIVDKKKARSEATGFRKKR